MSSDANPYAPPDSELATNLPQVRRSAGSWVLNTLTLVFLLVQLRISLTGAAFEALFHGMADRLPFLTRWLLLQPMVRWGFPVLLGAAALVVNVRWQVPGSARRLRWICLLAFIGAGLLFLSALLAVWKMQKGI